MTTIYGMTILFVSEKLNQKLRNLSMVERKRNRGNSWLQAETITNTLEVASASVEKLYQCISRQGTAINEGKKKLLLP